MDDTYLHLLCFHVFHETFGESFAAFFSKTFGPSRSERLGGYAMVFSGEESEASDAKGSEKMGMDQYL